MKYYTIYKIINLLNNKIYIGAHITSSILKDKYFGSSKHLKKDIKLLGKENFKKEILYIFDNKEDMIKMEREIVNKGFVFREDTYNRIIGGIEGSFSFINMLTVKNKNNENIKVYNDDPKYLSGELVSISKGKVTVKDKDGLTLRVDVNDERYLSGELVFEKTGKVNVKNKNGNTFCVNKNDERYLSGELVSIMAGTVTVKDINGNLLQVDKNDERYLSGELEHNLKNTIVVKDKDNNKFCVNKNDERYLSGELVGWAKGRIGIKGMLGKKRTEEYKENLRKKAKMRIGEKASGFGKIYINDGLINKRVLFSDLEKYLKEGWVKGRKMHKHKNDKTN